MVYVCRRDSGYEMVGDYGRSVIDRGSVYPDRVSYKSGGCNKCAKEKTIRNIEDLFTKCSLIFAVWAYHGA